MAEKRLCSVLGCGNAHYARGWCSRHYKSWQVHGSPTAAKPKKTADGEVLAYLFAHMWDDGCPRWPFSTLRGYGRLQFEGRVQYAHRAVCALVHGPPPTPRHEAAHNCGNGSRGCFGAKCVEWKTSAENQADRIEHGTSNRGSRHGMARLNEEQVREIRALEGQYLQREIAEMYGVTPTAITLILNRKNWGWLDT